MNNENIVKVTDIKSVIEQLIGKHAIVTDLETKPLKKLIIGTIHHKKFGNVLVIKCLKMLAERSNGKGNEKTFIFQDINSGMFNENFFKPKYGVHLCDLYFDRIKNIYYLGCASDSKNIYKIVN